MRISDWSSDVCSSDLPFARWCERRTGGHLAVSRLLDWGIVLFILFVFCPQCQPAQSLILVCSYYCFVFLFSRAWGIFENFFSWEIGRASCRERVCQYV